MKLQGVLPAITTEFRPDGSIDHDFVRAHVAWQVAAGARAIIPCGSLGEGATLDYDEKLALIESCVAAAGDVPVAPGIAALSTRSGVALARAAARAGCRGLMVLPPYVHKGPWSEMEAHFDALISATDLPCMLYNNPPAYGVDARPEAVARLAGRHANLVAVKESSGDARRVTAIRALCGARLDLCVGLDDMALEGVAAGARGWVAGLVNALPAESVALFELALAGRADEARALYEWFLPLLRLDTLPEFVQWIKLVQVEVGRGSERVRAPRAPIAGPERAAGLALIRERLAARPQVRR